MILFCGGIALKTYGIVAEYNPFHNGHKYHIDMIRQSGGTHIVAVMSGNFVQRGDVAVLDKFTRARLAVENGVDLVIELPTPYAVSTAETFARGAVSILSDMNCIDGISFGCENDDIALLRASAEASERIRNSDRLKEMLREGENYPSPMAEIVGEEYPPEVAEIFSSPNNLLALEYIRQANEKCGNSDILPIKRTSVGHDSDDISGDFASASKIREMLSNGEDTQKFVPYGTFWGSETAQLYSIKELEKVILYRMRTMTAGEISRLPDVSQGLEGRIVNAVKSATTLDELLSGIKTRRYPMARIRRIIISALLGVTSEDSAGNPPYARVLALNDRGAEVLKKAKKSSVIPVSTSLAELCNFGERAKRLALLESDATDIYSLACRKALPCKTDMTAKIEKTEN
mgnify:CR=1 FL=1